MVPSITKFMCIYVFSLSLFLCNMEVRERRFFKNKSSYENGNGRSNTTGYGKSYVNNDANNAYGVGSNNGYGSYRGQGNGNGYGSYRGQVNGNGYRYGHIEAYHLGSDSGVVYGEVEIVTIILLLVELVNTIHKIVSGMTWVSNINRVLTIVLVIPWVLATMVQLMVWALGLDMDPSGMDLMVAM